MSLSKDVLLGHFSSKAEIVVSAAGSIVLWRDMVISGAWPPRKCNLCVLNTGHVYWISRKCLEFQNCVFFFGCIYHVNFRIFLMGS